MTESHPNLQPCHQSLHHSGDTKLTWPSATFPFLGRRATHFNVGVLFENYDRWLSKQRGREEVGKQADGRTDGRTAGRTNDRTDEWTDGRKKRLHRDLLSAIARIDEILSVIIKRQPKGRKERLVGGCIMMCLQSVWLGHHLPQQSAVITEHVSFHSSFAQEVPEAKDRLKNIYVCLITDGRETQLLSDSWANLRFDGKYRLQRVNSLLGRSYLYPGVIF